MLQFKVKFSEQPTAIVPDDNSGTQRYLSELRYDLNNLGYPNLSYRPVTTLTRLVGAFTGLSLYTGNIRETRPETDIGKSIQSWSKSLRNRNPFSRSTLWFMCAKAEPFFINCAEGAGDDDKDSPIIIFDKLNRVTGLIKSIGEPLLYIFGTESGGPPIDTIGSSTVLNDMLGSSHKPLHSKRRAGAYAINSASLGQIIYHRPSVLSVPPGVRSHLERKMWDPYKDYGASIEHTSHQLFNRCQWLLKQPEAKIINRPEDSLRKNH